MALSKVQVYIFPTDSPFLVDLSTGNAMELFEIGLVDDMENLQATLLVTVTPTLASSGQTVGTICIGQDITKLKDGPRALG